MRRIATLAMLSAAFLVAGCNTVHGMGEDVKSVGRVFSDHPNGDARSR